MRSPILFLATSLSLLVGVAACSRRAPEHRIVVPVDGEVRLDVSEVSDGDAHFFTYKFGKKNVNFFARTDGAGNLLTHFDACYSCYKYRRGYVQEGREVVCIACRIGFDLDVEVWDWVGPCVPVSLTSCVRDDFVVISAKKLEKGAKLF